MHHDVQVVTFDGDQTLWDLTAGLSIALEDSSSRFHARGLRTPDGGPVTPAWLAAVRDQVARQPQFHRARLEVTRLAAFTQAARLAGAVTRSGEADEEFVQEVFEAFMVLRHSQVPLFQDTLPTLTRLKADGFRLGLVTNGNGRPGDLGLTDLLDVVVIAADVGLYKPDPAIYQHTADAFDAPVQACLHVGDHPDHDTRAAIESGMRAAWLNRAGEGPKTLPPGTPTVSSLDEVPGLIRTLHPNPQSSGESEG
jgi:putative hydrolase of the HAD superfamily